MSLLFSASYAKCPYNVLLYMQSVRIILIMFSALYGSVLIMYCFICKVSLLRSAFYKNCPYYVVLYMQSVRIVYCFICTVSLLCTALYANIPCRRRWVQTGRCRQTRQWRECCGSSTSTNVKSAWTHDGVLLPLGVLRTLSHLVTYDETMYACLVIPSR